MSCKGKMTKINIFLPKADGQRIPTDLSEINSN